MTPSPEGLNMTDELKPCPFCGASGRYLESNPGFWTERIICDACKFWLAPAAWSCRALLSASKPAAIDKEEFEEYRRGVKEAFHVANMINANRQGRTPEETCAYLVRRLAELANGGEAPAAPSVAQDERGALIDRLCGQLAAAIEFVRGNDFDKKEALALIQEARAASPSANAAAPAQSGEAVTDVPEGCTVADAKMLREANHALAAENELLRKRLRPFAHLVGSGELSWAMVEYCVKDDPEKQTFRAPQMQRVFNRAAEAYRNAAPQPAQTTQSEVSPIVAPYPNCSFRICDLPGQCRGEGKCHHPTAQPAQTERALTDAIDAAMVEMANISPPLRRSECERLIRAAMTAAQPESGGDHD